MKYVVIEMQTNADGTLGNFVWAFDDYNQAASKYHSVLAAAAISNLPVHSCAMMSNYGELEDVKVYEHSTNNE